MNRLNGMTLTEETIPDDLSWVDLIEEAEDS